VTRLKISSHCQCLLTRLNSKARGYLKQPCQPPPIQGRSQTQCLYSSRATSCIHLISYFLKDTPYKMADAQNAKAEWWTTVPAPRAKCGGISGDELMKMFDDQDIKPGPRKFLLVDVRRNDWEVRNIFVYHTSMPMAATESTLPPSNSYREHED
jgi:hypothetical protein